MLEVVQETGNKIMFRSWVTYHTAGNKDLVVQLLNISLSVNGDSMLVEGNVPAGGVYQAFKKYGRTFYIIKA